MDAWKRLVAILSGTKTYDIATASASKTSVEVDSKNARTTFDCPNAYNFINKDLAANTYHALELYCTSLNCPILARTEAYTEAFTSILFHPLSKKYHFTEECKLYRGCIIADEELVGNYKKGNTIITTTFLSESTDPAVVVPYITDAPTDAISIRCEYEINNNHCCTALDLRGVSKKKEEEILILRYTPFEITSAIQSESGGHMEVHFREYEEQ
ncbi:unnamed protein product [Adineta steineri]|uniref:NAD(+)--protein-arginine ADP-ribosyltransferase n=1 Tax=Adineta steineri TaxID=433720 RepID=A0A819JXY3_9BILA|nr:unnamed protein product [Adineta steineri]CAF3935138.1 unnamed protein product [Adineta steineri]